MSRGVQFAFRACALSCACIVGSAIAAALVPGGTCLIGPRTPPTAPQDAMWSLLAAGGLIGLVGYVAFVYSGGYEQRGRARIVLATVTVLQVAAVVAIIAFFMHQSAHCNDCG